MYSNNFKFQISNFVRRNSNFKFQPLKFKFENLTAKISNLKNYDLSINMIIFLMFFIHLSYILFINSISHISLTIYRSSSYMNRFPNILGEILNIEEEDNNDFDMLYAATRRSEGFSQGRIRRHRGSVTGHRMVNRDRVEGYERLYRDYFSTPCVYESFFRMRFRMSRPLFLRIVNEVEQYDPYFIQSTDAVGVLGLSSLQKITAAYRILAYGTLTDYVDEYIRIGESTAIESLRRFVKTVIVMFGDHYLRSPNNIDIARLLQTGEQHGFPGMLGSIDCMHWKWKNCPTA